MRALPSMAVVHSVGVSLGWVRTIDEAEGRALLEGLRLARGLGALSVRARVDCLRAIRMLEDGASLTDERQREVAALLKADAALFAGGVRALYAPSFHGATRRDGSQSADGLARKAAGLKDRVLRARRRRH